MGLSRGLRCALFEIRSLEDSPEVPVALLERVNHSARLARAQIRVLDGDVDEAIRILTRDLPQNFEITSLRQNTERLLWQSIGTQAVQILTAVLGHYVQTYRNRGNCQRGEAVRQEIGGVLDQLHQAIMSEDGALNTALNAARNNASFNEMTSEMSLDEFMNNIRHEAMTQSRFSEAVLALVQSLLHPNTPPPLRLPRSFPMTSMRPWRCNNRQEQEQAADRHFARRLRLQRETKGVSETRRLCRPMGFFFDLKLLVIS